MSDERASAPGWWQTLPGILTGLAAIITAVTGLVVAFNHTRGRADDIRPSSPPGSVGTPSGASLPSPSGSSGGPAAGAQAVALPAFNRVTLAGGSTVVAILSAQVEPLDRDRRSLKFVVRHTNAGRYPANFWSSSYRLIVDEVPRAPTNLLDEVVDGDSAKEGEVVFELPATVKNVVLQISAGDDKSRIPFTLP
jgi:hypothetical protein